MAPKLFVIGLCILAAPAQAKLSAGAGRAPIEIPADVLPLDGFDIVHDPLQARVLLLDSDNANRSAVAVVDQTSISADNVAAMQRAIAEATGVAATNILVIASHTFSAPHMFGLRGPPGVTVSADELRRAEAYRGAVLAAVTRAASDAAKAMRPARIGFATGSSDVNVNRNVLAADGWWLGTDDRGASDKAVAVVSIQSTDGSVIATLLNYAVQSAVMNQTGGAAAGAKGVTDDLGGSAARRIEDQRGGVAMFLTGAAGDQVPDYTAQRNVYDAKGRFRTVDIGAGGYPLIDMQGERLGDEAVRVAATAPLADAATVTVVAGSVPLDAQERPRSLQQIKPSKTYAFVRGAKAEAPFVVMQIGDIALVGVQAELSAATGQVIKQRSPFRRTIVATMVNGAAKYMPQAEDYRRITYEAMNSPYAPGSAEIFTGRIVDTLTRLHRAAVK